MTGEMIDLGLLRHGSLLHKLFLRLEHRINHGAADCVATRSAPLARDLVNQWGLPTSMVQSLPDGVDVSLFRPQNREETRAKLRLPANTPLAVYLGALNKNQNIDTLLSAIIQLKATGSPLRFLIMGFPEAEYRARAHDLGIERMITFTGQVDYTKAPLFISAGDCAVSPTCHPLQPNSKLLGYMACGLSTVAFDTPLNKELLGDGGVYAQRDDAADLANRLTWLINNPGEGNRIGLLARQRGGTAPLLGHQRQIAGRYLPGKIAKIITSGGMHGESDPAAAHPVDQHRLPVSARHHRQRTAERTTAQPLRRPAAGYGHPFHLDTAPPALPGMAPSFRTPPTPLKALDYAIAQPGPFMLILKDIHFFWRDNPFLVRKLKRSGPSIRKQGQGNRHPR